MGLDVILSLSYYCVVGMLLLALAVSSLFTLYIHYIHWKYSHIPSPKRPSFYFGHLSDVFKRRKDTRNDLIPLYEFHYQWYLSAGSPALFVVHFLWKVFVFTTNPEDIKKIVMDPKNPKTELYVGPLRSLYGERFLGNGLFNILDYNSWKPRRRVYDPAFKKGTLNNLVPSFNECVDRFLTRLRPLADGKTEVPMKVEFTDLTLDVISKVGFGSVFARQEWSDKEFGLKKFQRTRRLSMLLVNSMDGLQEILQSPFPELFPYLHPLKAEMYRETTRAIRKIARNCIHTRLKDMERGEPPGNDILGSIVEAIKTGEDIDPEDLVDDFFTFYVAGQETIMSLLSSALLALHLHPQVLERLLSEINEVLGDKEGVSVEDLEKLQFTEQVLQESLRLYPPAIGINKCAQKGGISLSGCHIPEGTTINMSTALLCRLPENFEEPEVFDPDRFNPDIKKPSSFVYFPFGIGHRSCLAKQFSMMEAKIILSRFLQTFRVSLPPDYKFVVAGRFTLQPKDAVPCTLETKL